MVCFFLKLYNNRYLLLFLLSGQLSNFSLSMGFNDEQIFDYERAGTIGYESHENIRAKKFQLLPDERKSSVKEFEIQPSPYSSDQNTSLIVLRIILFPSENLSLSFEDNSNKPYFLCVTLKEQDELKLEEQNKIINSTFSGLSEAVKERVIGVNFSSSRLRHIPEVIYSFPNLYFCFLHRNLLSNVDFSRLIKSCKYLRELDIRHNGLSKIVPEDIGVQLKDLRNICSNQGNSIENLGRMMTFSLQNGDEVWFNGGEQ